MPCACRQAQAATAAAPATGGRVAPVETLIEQLFVKAVDLFLTIRTHAAAVALLAERAEIQSARDDADQAAALKFGAKKTDPPGSP